MEEAARKEHEVIQETYHLQKISETLYQEGLISKAELQKMETLLKEEA